MIKSVLRIILDNKDDSIFPTRTIGDQIRGQPQGGIVILEITLIGPRLRPVWVNVIGTASMIIGIVEVYVCRELTHVVGTIHILGFEDLLETPKAVEARWVFGQRRVRNPRVIFGEEMVTVVTYDFFHR